MKMGLANCTFQPQHHYARPRQLPSSQEQWGQQPVVVTAMRSHARILTVPLEFTGKRTKSILGITLASIPLAAPGGRVEAILQGGIYGVDATLDSS